MRVLVAGWAGSTNLGDELVLIGMLAHLRTLGHEPVVLSNDPAATTTDHGVAALPAKTPLDLLRAAEQGEGLVFGGGGLLQDQTSPLNLPFHLARVWAAQRRRLPVVGVGLGVGGLTTRLGHALVRRTFSRAPLSVRDDDSADLLSSIGMDRPTVSADLALHLPDPVVTVQDRVVVCLRPWSGRRSVLPASLQARRADAAPEARIDQTARALDEVSQRLDLPVHLVAFQADRDGPLHDAVADRMTAPVTTSRPSLHDLVAEVCSGRVVVSTRYHGGISAVLGARPVVLIGYSQKVVSLAAELGPAGALLPWRDEGPVGLADRVAEVIGRDDDQAGVRERLRLRELRNAVVLAQL